MAPTITCWRSGRSSRARTCAASRRPAAARASSCASSARGAGAGSRSATACAGSASVADDELAALYRGARCVVYPSLYEGFGLPVLEAMACGTPVVTSAGGAMEEVAGGAAVLVDPLDTRSIAAGIAEASAGARSSPAGLGGCATSAGSAPPTPSSTSSASSRERARLLRRGRARARSGRETRRTSRTSSASCPPRAPDLRFAAITRHPELVPPASSLGCRRARRSCAWRGRCRGCCAGSAAARALPARAPARAARRRRS